MNRRNKWLKNSRFVNNKLREVIARKRYYMNAEQAKEIPGAQEGDYHLGQRLYNNNFASSALREFQKTCDELSQLFSKVNLERSTKEADEQAKDIMKGESELRTLFSNAEKLSRRL